MKTEWISAEQTPMSDNELIAEFMGGWNDNNNSRYLGMNVPADGNPHWEDQWYDYKDMKYQTSWDWLMPVVEKIRILGETSMIPNTAGRVLKDIAAFSIITNKESIYKAVVEFIKWYNSQPHKL